MVELTQVLMETQDLMVLDQEDKGLMEQIDEHMLTLIIMKQIR